MRHWLLALTLVAFASANAQDKFALKRTPAAGEATSYRLKVETSFQGMAVVYTARTTEKVEAVNADGSYVTSEEQSEVKIVVGGQEMPGQDATEDSRTTVGPDGVVTKIDSPSASDESYRMSNLMGVAWPSEMVGPGSKWESKLPADPERSGVAVDRAYEVLAVEEVAGKQAAKVAWTAVERTGATPASAKGTVWVEIATGRVLKLAAELKSAPLSGQALDATVSIELAS